MSSPALDARGQEERDVRRRDGPPYFRFQIVSTRLLLHGRSSVDATASRPIVPSTRPAPTQSGVLSTATRTGFCERFRPGFLRRLFFRENQRGSSSPAGCGHVAAISRLAEGLERRCSPGEQAVPRRRDSRGHHLLPKAHHRAPRLLGVRVRRTAALEQECWAAAQSWRAGSLSGAGVTISFPANWSQKRSVETASCRCNPGTRNNARNGVSKPLHHHLAPASSGLTLGVFIAHRWQPLCRTRSWAAAASRLGRFSLQTATHAIGTIPELATIDASSRFGSAPFPRDARR